MAAFKEFNDLVDHLVLPINGKSYEIPLVTVEGRMKWEAVQADVPEGEDPPTPLTDDEFEHIFMGDTIDQMRADNVPDLAISRALSTAFTYAVAGKDTAEIFWETGGHPKALKAYVNAHLPNRASRRSQSTGAANTTQSQRRGSGTKSRKK
jgi:hypothetical protein